MPLNETARAEQLIGEFRQLVQSNSTDLARLRQSTSDLQQIAAGLAAGGPGRATADGGGSGPRSPRPGGPDDVIDAEFNQR